MNELEQAKELRDEARELLSQANVNLSKSVRFTDMALNNQRSLVYAMSSLLPKPMTISLDFAKGEDTTEKLSMSNGSTIHFIDSGDQVAEVAFDLAQQMKNREVFDIIHSINVLAMANAHVVHIFPAFAAHVNQFSVRASPSNTDYSNENRKCERLLGESVYLDEEDVLEQLLSIESKLTELIIEAREAAETRAEGESC